MSKEIKKELTENQKEKVAGGYTFSQGALEGFRYEVIDDADGHVVGRYSTREEALEMAKVKGQSVKELGWRGLNKLREVDKKPEDKLISQPAVVPIKPIVNPSSNK